MALTPEQLTGIRERTAETAKSYLLAGGQPSQMAQDREDLLAEVERSLPIEHVERFLKRERDEYSKQTRTWRTLDRLLDAFRLHMVTGTPLTEPRPTDGPEAPGVGPEPLTEAEELRAELAELQGQNTQTEANFEVYVEDAILREAELRQRAEKAEAERDELRDRVGLPQREASDG